MTQRKAKALPPTRRQTLLIAVLFLLVGCILSYFAWEVWSVRQVFLSRAVRAQATVIAFKKGGGDTPQIPVVRYFDRLGNAHTFDSDPSSQNRANTRIGDTIAIRYDPDDPTRAIPERNVGIPLKEIVITAFAAGFLFFGGLTLANAVKVSSRPASA
ncbi:MAG: DUF3592 domain-containing protein [Candidatus Omnitrophica bacterium]|nr:DUF3592 domain-containing protein [Candidatus Omnitrophota bacterium]MCB9721917.1 DUF3592 domain-containing protein [Candidatus Omnitrophota bacterium]